MVHVRKTLFSQAIFDLVGEKHIIAIRSVTSARGTTLYLVPTTSKQSQSPTKYADEDGGGTVDFAEYIKALVSFGLFDVVIGTL